MSKCKISMGSKVDLLLVAIEAFRADVSGLKTEFEKLRLYLRNKSSSVPRRKSVKSRIESNRAVRQLALELLGKGLFYSQVTDELNKIPNFKTSISAVSRFWISCEKEKKRNDCR